MTLTTRTRSSAKAPALDAQGAAAVDLARAAALELAAPDGVGDHLGAEPDDERVVTHFFACLSPAYVGWRWAVTVARASRSRIVTVDEAVLLPGGEAVLAPAWLPWNERLRPGDLGVGDVLPTEPGDPRLEPGYVGALAWSLTADEGGLDGESPFPDEDAAVAWELGLGRHRVLSPIGRDDAIDRWYSGDRGPAAPIAEAAPAGCGSCGFLLRMGGSLRRVFGVCANEYAPDDGRVVSLDHGCGAHSEAAVLAQPGGPAPLIVDELGYDELHARLAVDELPPRSAPHTADATSDPDAAGVTQDPTLGPTLSIDEGVELAPAGSEAEPLPAEGDAAAQALFPVDVVGSAGSVDAGSVDAGSPGAFDAGSVDAGSPGTFDAGPVDAGPADAGDGTPVEAANTDGGDDADR